MKVLIQHLTTRHYLREDDSWTGEKSLAKDFGTSISALDHCHKKKLKEVDIVMDFEDLHYNLSLSHFPKRHNSGATGS